MASFGTRFVRQPGQSASEGGGARKDRGSYGYRVQRAAASAGGSRTQRGISTERESFLFDRGNGNQAMWETESPTWRVGRTKCFKRLTSNECGGESCNGDSSLPTQKKPSIQFSDNGGCVSDNKAAGDNAQPKSGVESTREYVSSAASDQSTCESSSKPTLDDQTPRMSRHRTQEGASAEQVPRPQVKGDQQDSGLAEAGPVAREPIRAKRQSWAELQREREAKDRAGERSAQQIHFPLHTGDEQRPPSCDRKVGPMQYGNVALSRGGHDPDGNMCNSRQVANVLGANIGKHGFTPSRQVKEEQALASRADAKSSLINFLNDLKVQHRAHSTVKPAFQEKKAKLKISEFVPPSSWTGGELVAEYGFKRKSPGPKRKDEDLHGQSSEQVVKCMNGTPFDAILTPRNQYGVDSHYKNLRPMPRSSSRKSTEIEDLIHGGHHGQRSKSCVPPSSTFSPCYRRTTSVDMEEDCYRGRTPKSADRVANSADLVFRSPSIVSRSNSQKDFTRDASAPPSLRLTPIYGERPDVMGSIIFPGQ